MTEKELPNSMTREKLWEEWNAFEKQSFPIGHRGVQQGGMGITLVQSDISACTLTFLQTNKQLSSHRIDMLNSRVSLLESMLTLCTTEGRPYFETLVKLGKQVSKLNVPAPTDPIVFSGNAR